MAIVDETGVALKTEVGAVLSAAGGVVDQDDTETYFTEEAKLNWTSKYKPVPYPADFVDGNGRWKGADNNCGFIIPNSSNYSSIPGWYGSSGEVGENGWEYDIPDGNTTSRPMRLGDFRGYCTDVIPFVQGFTCPGKGERAEGSTLTCMIAVGISSSTHLGLSDIGTLASCYFGVYAVNAASSSNTRIAFGSNNNTVELPCHDMTLGDWKIFPFFSNARSHASGTKYYPVPFVGMKTVTMVSSIDQITMQITGVFDSSDSTCTWTIQAKNTGADTTVQTNFIYLKFDGNDLSTSLETGEKQYRELAVTVETSDTFVAIASGTFTNVTSSSFFNEHGVFTGKLWFSFGGGAYTNKNGVSPMLGAGGQS